MAIGNIFGNLFGQDASKGDTPGEFPWIASEDPSGKALFDSVHSGGIQVVFKHSNSCGISRIMLGRFENRWPTTDIPYFLIDVKRNRTLSDTVAREFECRHQSPQVLVIRDGKLIANASHGDIDGLDPVAYLP